MGFFVICASQYGVPNDGLLMRQTLWRAGGTLMITIHRHF